MKNKKFGVSLFVFVVVMFSVGIMSLNAKMTEEKIVGTVTATEWDDDDNVVAVSISVTIVPEDPDEDSYTEDYEVTKDDEGKKLNKLVDETLEVVGMVEVDEFGNKKIHVKSFTVVEKEE